MAGYDTLYNLLKLEIAQRDEEGCPVDRKIWFKRLERCNPSDYAELCQIYNELASLEPTAHFQYSESSDLADIREKRPEHVWRMKQNPLGLTPIVSQTPKETRDQRDSATLRFPFEELANMHLGSNSFTEASQMGRDTAQEQTCKRNQDAARRELLDRIHGGWAGRCCGCMLGKPFDTPPFTVHPQNLQQRDIQLWLEIAEAWPLDNYIPPESPGKRWGLSLTATECTLGHISRVEADVNLDATLMAIQNVEENGLNFSTSDIALLWLKHLPLENTTPAQNQAMATMITNDWFARKNRSPEMLETVDWGEIAERYNPFREWNDAMIRADVYGYIAPGNPELAAEMAWRDASASCVKNGIYGAMFIAALTSASFLEPDVETAIRHALSEIPIQSRLARGIRTMLKLHKENEVWTDCWDGMMEEVGNYHPSHAVPNAMICVMALLYGQGDFTRSISLAVCAGLSPAANGATVGSILGVRAGRRGLPQQWTLPLNNRLCSHIPGHTEGTISDGARRCMQVLKT